VSDKKRIRALEIKMARLQKEINRLMLVLYGMGRIRLSVREQKERGCGC